MQVSKKQLTAVSVELSVTADEADLSDAKRSVLNEMRRDVKAPGFRPGKAPDKVVEQQLGEQTVQTEVLNRAVSRLLNQAIINEDLHLIGQPELAIKKFVPYAELEFTAVCEVSPKIKLADYKKFKSPKTQSDKPSKEQIDEVLNNLRRRLAEKKPVKRAAKSGDEVWIDFVGKDKQGKPVKGASGEDFPLNLGSNTFIPGFEENLLGTSAGEKKKFDVIFPSDYHSAQMRGAKVSFEVTVKKVNELVLPKLDDELAAKASPFKTLKELKEDIALQLENEINQQQQRQRREAIVTQLVEKSQLELPPKLTERVLQDIKAEFQRNLQNRGLSEEDYYTSQNTNKENNEKELQAAAERRVKASLTLSEVASAEKLSVDPKDLEVYVESLKERYKDNQQLLGDLDKPEVREDIALQILTERTIDKMLAYAEANS